MKLFIILALTLVLTSCTQPSDYSGGNYARLSLGGKEYKASTVNMCGGGNPCYVWFVYPVDGTGVVMLQSETGGKHSQAVPVIILP